MTHPIVATLRPLLSGYVADERRAAELVEDIIAALIDGMPGHGVDGMAKAMMQADMLAADGGCNPGSVTACFAATAHDGGCTSQANACLLCEAERYRALARAALSGLSEQIWPGVA